MFGSAEISEELDLPPADMGMLRVLMVSKVHTMPSLSPGHFSTFERVSNEDPSQTEKLNFF